MRVNHQLREALYNNGFKMSPEARRSEVENIIKERESKKSNTKKESK